MSDEISGVEIPDELLESVTGGKMDLDMMKRLGKRVRELKQRGFSPKDICNVLHIKNSPNYEEYFAFILTEYNRS